LFRNISDHFHYNHYIISSCYHLSQGIEEDDFF